MSVRSMNNLPLDEIPPVRLTKTQNELYQKMANIIFYFFTRTSNIPLKIFRGFLIEGPPASGKTEVVIQVAKTLKLKLKNQIPPRNLDFRFIDSSVIAAPHWGEAEKRLSNEFTFSRDEKLKRIILIDDVDCLMMTRGSNIAKEWHYSINSVIFHKLDRMDPSNAIVIATTNREDLIDEALRSRLYSMSLEIPSKDELKAITSDMIRNMGLGNYVDELSKGILNKINQHQKPTLRDVQFFLIEECIEKGYWGSADQ